LLRSVDAAGHAVNDPGRDDARANDGRSTVVKVGFATGALTDTN
jgi:hypothetical protein